MVGPENNLQNQHTDQGDCKQQVLYRLKNTDCLEAVSGIDKITPSFDLVHSTVSQLKHHKNNSTLVAFSGLMPRENLRSPRNRRDIRISHHLQPRLIIHIRASVFKVFLQRRTSSPLEFDLDLAKEQSDRNPVFYIQYAHTRICGILRQKGCPVPSAESDLTPLVEAEELTLVKHLEKFPEVIARAAETREPQKIVGFLNDLATRFHKFYTAHRVVGVEAKTSEARAALCSATKIVLAEGLNLLGVSAPEKM